MTYHVMTKLNTINNEVNMKFRHKLKINICETCKKEFHPNYASPNSKYCSKSCSWVERSKNSINRCKCSIENCDKNIYAKNLCRNHYTNFIRSGNPIAWGSIKMEERKCILCGIIFHSLKSNKIKCCSKICSRILMKSRFLGDKNPNWNGGVAQYPNHCIMKKNRIIKLNQQQGKCEVCSMPANKIHHKDEDKSNHALDNLSVLCNKCHGVVHSGGIKKTSIFIRKYGMSSMEMVKKYGKNSALYYRMHRSGELTLYLNKLSH